MLKQMVCELIIPLVFISNDGINHIENRGRRKVSEPN